MIGNVLLVFAAFWGCLHGVHALLTRITRFPSKRSSELQLPNHTDHRNNGHINSNGGSYFGDPDPEEPESTSRYRAWLEKNGIKLSFLQLQFKSSRFGRYFYRLALLAPQFWRLWFTLGVFVVCILHVLGPILVAYNVAVMVWDMLPSFSFPQEPALPPELSGDTQAQQHQQLMMADGAGALASAPAPADAPRPARQFEMRPMIPGINIPAEHAFVFFVVGLVSTLIHEAGHGIAAALHDVYIESCGIFLQAVLPGAFVELHTPQLFNLKPFQQLRITCAGVWHNIIVGLLSLLLFACLPGWYP